MMLASASTGTAISALSGAAATNATLAWFGGGSLAAGGMGMTGGIAVLGGVVAGPVLAGGGVVLEAKARDILSNARENLAAAKVAAKEMNTAESICQGIFEVSSLFYNTIEGVSDRFEPILVNFENIIETNDNKYWRDRILNRIS